MTFLRAFIVLGLASLGCLFTGLIGPGLALMVLAAGAGYLAEVRSWLL